MEPELKSLKTYQCDFCVKVFSKIITLRAHLRCHIDEKSFKCLNLNYDKDFVEAGQLKSYQKIYLPPEEKETFVCTYPKCEKIFTAKKGLKNHISVKHMGESFQCDFPGCEKKILNKRHLQRHQNRHKTNGKLFPCTFLNCFKKFTEKPSMLNHIKTIHIQPNHRPHCCFLCSKRFKSKSNINKHIKTHSQQIPSYECGICLKKYINKSHLSRHVKDKHSGISHNCQHCEKVFSGSSGLGKHLKYHHGPKSTEKPFKCYFCGRRIKRKESMANHLKIHTRERFFKCGACCKRFISKGDMTSHEKTHQDIRQRRKFPCSLCPRRYVRNSMLKMHVDVAHRGRLHKCLFCNKVFGLMGSLNGHIVRAHTKERPFSCDKCGYASVTNVELRSHKLQHA